MPSYDPFNWYWLADDGRLFSSRERGLLAQDDANYAEWRAAGGVPTPWPRDDDGGQTDASLAEVLSPYGIPVVTSFSSRKAAKIDAITRESNRILALGAPVAGGLHVALDDGSRADLTALAALAAAVLITNGVVTWPEALARGWITIENSRVPLPAALDGLIFAASVGSYYSAIMQHRRDLKDGALAAADEAALAAIDVTAGWPAGA